MTQRARSSPQGKPFLRSQAHAAYCRKRQPRNLEDVMNKLVTTVIEIDSKQEAWDFPNLPLVLFRDLFCMHIEELSEWLAVRSSSVDRQNDEYLNFEQVLRHFTKLLSTSRSSFRVRKEVIKILAKLLCFERNENFELHLLTISTVLLGHHGAVWCQYSFSQSS